MAVKGKVVGRLRLGEFAGLVTPETILRWYRELIARKYDSSARRGTWHPMIAADVQNLIVQFASENPRWGYTRLVGALANLGYKVGRNTIKHILHRHGLEPAPLHGKRMPWKTFIRTTGRDRCGGVLLGRGTDVEQGRSLPRAVRDRSPDRRVQIGGVMRQAYGAWMKQIARNLTDGTSATAIRRAWRLPPLTWWCSAGSMTPWTRMGCPFQELVLAPDATRLAVVDLMVMRPDDRGSAA
jgi:hypothetical protein